MTVLGHEPEKTWVYGGVRLRDGQAVTMCAECRNSACYQDFLTCSNVRTAPGTSSW